jgi:hypothetical protein
MLDDTHKRSGFARTGSSSEHDSFDFFHKTICCSGVVGCKNTKSFSIKPFLKEKICDVQRRVNQWDGNTFVRKIHNH